MRSFALAILAGFLWAADLNLTAPQRLDVHPDGALAHFEVDLPAGVHRLILSDTMVEGVSCQVPAWHEECRTVSEAPIDEPAGLADLVSVREGLVAEQAVVSAHRRALDLIRQQVVQALPTRVGEGGAGPAVDALVAAVAENDARQAEIDQAVITLEARALALGSGSAGWLQPGGIAQGVALGLEDARQAWRGQVQTRTQRSIVVQLAQAQTVVVSVNLPVTWVASAQIDVRGRQVRLQRQVRLRKAAHLDLGTPQVRVLNTARASDLAAPDLPGLQLGLEQAPSARQIDQSSLAVSGSSLSLPGEAMSVARDRGQAPVLPQAEAAVRESVAAVQPGLALSWDLGRLDLKAGAMTVEASLPVRDLVVQSDEWALIPAISTVAIRRIICTLDDQPLLAGMLSVAVDGRRQGASLWPALAGGSSLELRVDEDPTIFVAPAIPWDVPDQDRTTTRRRQGSTTTIHYRGEVPRRVAVYATIPKSGSAELKVDLDERTTAGWQEVASGVLRWDLDLSPGRSTWSLGWLLTAKGGLSL